MEYMIGSDGLYKITESGSIITMENYICRKHFFGYTPFSKLDH